MLAPMFLLALWTYLILLWMAVARIRAGSKGAIAPADFALGESARVPVHVRLANRNYMNLLELPVLFYVVCLITYVAGIATPALAGLAWAYAALRVLHSLVHLTYNHVMHRLAVFAASNFVLLALWALAGMGLIGKGGA
jgi:hypothetical protein